MRTCKLSYCSPQQIKIALESQPQKWDAFLERERKYKEVNEGKTIPLLLNRSGSDNFVPDFHTEHKELWQQLQPALRIVQELKGPGYWCRALLAMLPPGRKIAPHLDPGWAFTYQERFHWVIDTNPDVQMIVDGETYHFEEGEIWSFDNKKIHSVTNRGSSPRIHAIFDFVSASAGATFCKPIDTSSREGRMLSFVFRRNRV